MMTDISFTKRLRSYFLLLAIVPLLFSCSKEEENVDLAPSDVSGSILIRSGTQVDSDTNNPDSTVVANNTPETAQNLPNPVELGGYVNVARNGTAGTLFLNGDPDDYYSVYLLVNHSINLDALLGDISLSVMSPNSSTFDPVAGTTFTATSEGTHFIRIHANSGASNYTLKIGAGITATALNEPTQLDFVPGEVIVRYKEATQVLKSRKLGSNLLGITANLGFKVRAGHPSRDMLLSVADPSNRAAVRTSLNIQPGKSLKQETLDIIAALKQRSDVEDARPNYIFRRFAVPGDPGYRYMWDYQMMNMEAAWDISKGNSQTIVAVLDTGILSNHVDFAGKLVPGYDFIRSAARARDNEADFTNSDIDSNPEDVGDNPPNSSFHGTHVSGTIGAATDNGDGIPAVGWNIKVMPLRVLGVDGGTEYDIEQAILYAIGEPNDSGTVPDQPAQVINMSLGGPVSNLALPPAFQKAMQKNVFIVAAAGNDSPSTPIPYTVFPAGLPGVISVGALGSDKKVTSYSNYGSFLSLAAPGGDVIRTDRNNDGQPDWILSTLGSDKSGSIQLGYGFEIGTSMASPHAAAVIALMKSVYPDMTRNEFQNWLSNGLLTEDLAPLGHDDHTGYGLLDAEKALKVAFNAANGPLSTAVLSLSPSSLDFGGNSDTLTFRVENSGTDPLTVTSVSSDQNWTTITPLGVDNNGVGEYRISADRNGLAAIQYNGVISVTSSAGSGTIPFSLLSQPAVDNAGVQYVRLTNTSDASIRFTVRATYLNGQYGFAFSGITPGNYQLSSFSNVDNNGASECDSGESCGSYIATSNNSSIISVAPNKPVSGIKFYTGFFSVNATLPLDFSTPRLVTLQ